MEQLPPLWQRRFLPSERQTVCDCISAVYGVWVPDMDGWRPGIMYVYIRAMGHDNGFGCVHEIGIRGRFALHTSNSAERTACFLPNGQWPSILLRIRSFYVAIPQTSACRHSAPCSPPLHPVEQSRYASAQRPLAMFAYEEVAWCIFNDFRHLSAFALPSSVAD